MLCVFTMQTAVTKRRGDPLFVAFAG